MRRNLMRIISLEEEQVPEQVQTEENEDLDFVPLVSAVEEEQVVVSEDKAKEIEEEKKVEETTPSEVIKPNNGSEEEAEDPVESRPVVSMEEEQYMLTKALNIGEEINSDIADAERSVDIVKALEDLATIADSIEAATPTEIALMETAGDIIVAGTDISAEKAVPSMESLVGRKLSMESNGFIRTAKQIWDSIVNFLKGIWNKINDFFYNLFGKLPKYIKKTESILENAKKKTVRKNSEIFFDISNDYYDCIYAEDKVLSDEGNFKNKITELETITKYVFVSFTKSCSNVCKLITETIKNIKDEDGIEDKIDSMLEKCFENYFDTDLMKKLKPNLTLVDNPEMTEKVYDKMISGGGFSVSMSKIPDHLDGEHTALHMISFFRSSHIKFHVSDSNKDIKVKSLPILSNTAIRETTTSIKNILKTIEGFERGANGLKALVQEAKKMQDACESMSKQAEITEVNKLKVYFKELASLNVNYARWTNEVQSAFARFYLPKIGVYLSYISASLNNYKEA